jgi:hypothetical protein
VSARDLKRFALIVVATLAVACGRASALESPGMATISPSPTGSALAATSRSAMSPTSSAAPFGCPADFDGELAAIIDLKKIQVLAGTAVAPIGLESYSANLTRTHDGDQSPSFVDWNADAPAANVSLGGTLTLTLSADARSDVVVARYFRWDRLPNPVVGSDPTPVATRTGTGSADGTATSGADDGRGVRGRVHGAFRDRLFLGNRLDYVSVSVR